MAASAAEANNNDRRFLGAIPGRWLWLAMMLLLLLGILALGAWIWWFKKPLVIEQIIPAQAAELAPDIQKRAVQLADEIAALEKAIADARSQNNPLLCPPGQKLRQGAALAPAPLAPTATGPLKTLTIPELTDRLEKATALVLTSDSIATGFFIAPDLLMTNRHAVEDAKNGRLLIASASLGRAVPAQVVRTSASGKPGAADFALVRLTEGSAPATLPLTSQNGKLTAIVAAGYPGLTVQNDPGFRRLVSGDPKSAPDLNLTQGVVQSLQTSPQGVPVVLHTASILQGNSGGPLVDSCGRVIGINTFITVDAENAGRISYAQTSGAISDFLAQSGGRLPLDSRPCPSN
ncbi:serine protease [Lacibacterium aquatile]|uniref:Serine protease n=1 Tax=Lacibacterium aquatile TaxID=1168082 RepID=A0ABW5DX65_9PROT